MKAVRPLAILIGSTAAMSLLIALPGGLLLGESGVVFPAVAALLCVVPACVTFLLARLTREVAPEQEMFVILGGSGLRMFLVLIGAMALKAGAPYFEPFSFLISVLFFYMFTLLIEVMLLVRRQTEPTPQ